MDPKVTQWAGGGEENGWWSRKEDKQGAKAEGEWGESGRGKGWVR